MVQFLDLYMTTSKTIALIMQTFVGKVMSLLLNILSRFAIAFLPRSKNLLISWLQSPSAMICIRQEENTSNHVVLLKAIQREGFFWKCHYVQLSSVQLLSRVRLFVTQEQWHARPPCPSPTPGVHSNSCPSSQ